MTPTPRLSADRDRPGNVAHRAAALIVSCLLAATGPRFGRRARRIDAEAEGRLQPRGPADPGEELLRLPRPGRGEAGQGVAARRPRVGHQAARERRGGDRPRRPGFQRADRPDHRRGRRRSACRRGRRATGSRRPRSMIFRRWIEQGAEYARHWALIPPESLPLPKSDDPAWPRNGIDFWILAPAGEGGPEALAGGRRLHAAAPRQPGPPRTAADARGGRSLRPRQAPDAYERAVDRFLDDPAYGERWARIWLDLARYADSAGFGSDPLRPNIWRYRDWVIDAFNRNLPYDRFTLSADRRRPAARSRASRTGSPRPSTATR